MGENAQRPLVYLLCIGNAMRSQMAEAFLRHHAGDRLDAASAGTHPASRVFPEVVAVMQERGISMNGHHPKPIDADTVTRAARIVDLGGRAAARIPRAHIHKFERWDIPDPYGGSEANLRETRDEIERRIQALIRDL